MAVAYSKTREQFGRKIAEFQAVKHQLARLGLDVEPTRGLYWYAAYAVDHLPDDGERAAALAKSHVSDRAVATGRMAVELHGGLGFTWECDVQMWLKRAMFDRAFLGTPEALRERCATLAGW
jgi:alkylation response protein AidB-like acyl-CoA dehydrogenase